MENPVGRTTRHPRPAHGRIVNALYAVDLTQAVPRRARDPAGDVVQATDGTGHHAAESVAHRRSPVG